MIKPSEAGLVLFVLLFSLLLFEYLHPFASLGEVGRRAFFMGFIKMLYWS